MQNTPSMENHKHEGKQIRSVRLFQTCLLAAALGTQPGCAQSKPAMRVDQIQTYGTGYVHVPAVGRHCNDNGCGVRVLLRVEVPEGANVVAIRYYTTAGGEEGDHAIRAVNPGDIGWSYMEPALTKNENGRQFVETVYINRSDNRSREAALEVDAITR